MITPGPLELLTRVPRLTALGRTATRLHPRPGPVTANDSHIGGPLRWPASDPWPTCDTPHMVREEVPIPEELVARLRELERRRSVPHVLAEGEWELYEEIRRLVGPGYTGFGSQNGGPVLGHRYVPRPHATPNPMVPLAQLRAADVPDLPRPGGADLLQVLWCPFDHGEPTHWGPALRLYWRREAEVTSMRTDPPRGKVGQDGYLPRPCQVHPERVVEYPHSFELPDEIRTALTEEQLDDYSETALAPGWKVGGYPRWGTTDPYPLDCPRCTGPTTLALVIDSSEYDGATAARWNPPTGRDNDALEPTCVIVGRYGALRIFVCPRCPDTPFLLDQQ